MYYPAAYYRSRARAALKNHWQTALLIALIVNLPTMLVQAVTAFSGNNPAMRLESLVITASRDGVLSRELLTSEIAAFLKSTGFLVTQGLNLAAWVVTPCLALGMFLWMINRHHGMEEPVSAVFSRTRYFFRALGLQLLVILKVLLWMLPGIALTVGAAYMMMNSPAAPVTQAGALRMANYLSLPAFLAMLIPGGIAALRYALAQYVQAEKPETRIRACILRSKELMADQKRALFFLLFSFLLWYLLETLIASFLAGQGSSVFSLVFQMLAELALNVYMSASVTAFYLQLTDGEAPGGKPAGEAGEGPGPEAAP